MWPAARPARRHRVEDRRAQIESTALFRTPMHALLAYAGQRARILKVAAVRQGNDALCGSRRD